MTASDKRQRHKEGHRSRIEEAREAEARARRKQAITVAAILVVLVVAGTVIVSLTSRDDKQAVKTTTPSDTLESTSIATTDPAAAGSTQPAESTLPSVSLPVAKAGASITGDTPCPKADGSSERTTSFAKAPPTCIDKGKTYSAAVKTSEGDIVIALDSQNAPVAVNNFVVLARYHFWNGSTFHRIVPGFVDQTGGIGPDPGTSGPGYDLPEEKPTRKYEAGDVAMAASPSGPSGSQFFFTIDPTSLNSAPNYPLLGKVTSGQDVVEAINKLGQADAAGSGAPTKVVTIDDVTITES